MRSFPKKGVVMQRYVVHALPKARLMLLLVTATPKHLDVFNSRELELLMEFKDQALSGLGICCASEVEARRLLENTRVPGKKLQANVIISYPTIMFVEIVHLCARHGSLVAVVKSSFPSRTTRRARVADERYYFLFDIQLTIYSDLLMKIHGFNK